MIGCTCKGQLNLQFYWELFQGTVKEAVPASLRVLHRSLSPSLGEVLFQHQPWDNAIGMTIPMTIGITILYTTPYLMEKYAYKAQYKLKSVTEQFC